MTTELASTRMKAAADPIGSAPRAPMPAASLAVSRDSESGGPLPWVLGLSFLVAVVVCLSPGVAHAQVDCSATGTTGVPQIECEALMALYVSTDGTNWTDRSNWDTASAVATWFGVGAAGGHVTGISLGTNVLTGTIPPELGDLSSLETLHLYGNQLSGDGRRRPHRELSGRCSCAAPFRRPDQPFGK